MFYIDIDLISKLIYIFPMSQDGSHRYLISVKTRYEADQIMRKLTSGLYIAPSNQKNFEYNGEVNFGELSFLSYKLITQ